MPAIPVSARPSNEKIKLNVVRSKNHHDKSNLILFPRPNIEQLIVNIGVTLPSPQATPTKTRQVNFGSEKSISKLSGAASKLKAITKDVSKEKAPSKLKLIGKPPSSTGVSQRQLP